MADDQEMPKNVSAGPNEPTRATEPTTPPSKETGGASLLTYVSWVVVVLLVYVLSFGPVYRVFGAAPAVGVTYAPVLWAYEWVPPFRPVLDRYMALWRK